jgi:hypothetical protein
MSGAVGCLILREATMIGSGGVLTASSFIWTAINFQLAEIKLAIRRSMIYK